MSNLLIPVVQQIFKPDLPEYASPFDPDLAGATLVEFMRGPVGGTVNLGYKIIPNFETLLLELLGGGGGGGGGGISLDSPFFTGDPRAPTPPPGDNDNSIATTAFVTNAIAARAAPAVLAISANRTLSALDWGQSGELIVLANTAGGSVNVTLPLASSVAGRFLYVSKAFSAANVASVTRTGADLLSTGLPSFDITVRGDNLKLFASNLGMWVIV